METISIMDGLVLTVVSMLVVFVVLGAIWGLVELVSKFFSEKGSVPETSVTHSTKNQQDLASNKKHQRVAELIALVLASEDEPNKKFEIIESKRVK